MGLFALVLLFYRRRSDERYGERERAATRAQAEAEAYQRYARAMLALRDLANSPLQTATNLVTLLRVRAPEHADLTDKLERAVAGWRRMARCNCR